MSKDQEQGKEQIVDKGIKDPGREKSEKKESAKEKTGKADPEKEEAAKEDSAKEDSTKKGSDKEEPGVKEKSGGEEPDKETFKKDIEDEDDDDLYSDEVYKDTDSSEEDIEYYERRTLGDRLTRTVNKLSIQFYINRDEILAEIGIWLLVCFCAGAYILLTFNNNVWLDEAFTATLIKTDLAGVISRSMEDTLPPLYNIILKLSTDIFGYTVTVMKITSAVPMILVMILGATVVKKRYGKMASGIFIIAVTAMPNMLFYGVEIRMYSLGFLFATATAIFLGELLYSPTLKNWIFFTMSAVLAGYSHHFAFISAGFMYLFLFVYSCFEQKKYIDDEDREKHPIRITPFFICLLATIALYFPCFLVTLKQLDRVSGYFSMPEVTLSVFIKYCRYPFTVGFTPFSVLLALLVLFLFIMLCLLRSKTIHDQFTLYCFVQYYCVLLFGTFISRIMAANIFVDRYLFFSLGALWLFFSIRSVSLKKPFVYCIIAFEILIGVYSYTLAVTSEYSPGADETIEWLSKNVAKGDTLYTLEESEELAYCLPFYNNALTNCESLDEAVTEAGEEHNVWIAVLEGYEDEDPGSLPKGNLGYDTYMDEIIGKGYDTEYISEFRFDRYMYKMYKLVR